MKAAITLVEMSGNRSIEASSEGRQGAAGLWEKPGFWAENRRYLKKNPWTKKLSAVTDTKQTEYHANLHARL
jgi:hypothetical protein